MTPDVDALVRAELAADLGHGGDITSRALIPAERLGEATLLAKHTGVAAGTDAAAHAFRVMDPDTEIAVHTPDGTPVGAGSVMLTARAPVRALLAAERTALNLLGHLGGIATATATLVRAVAPHGARLADTRKTTPGLRGPEKAAVRAGGGMNHRHGLDGGVLIKDTHRALAGADGLAALVRAARAEAGHMRAVAIEVETLDEVDAAMRGEPDVVLLDNMDTATMAEAVRRIGGRATVEASGGIAPETAAEVARAGVDVLSVGWITHSAPALDVSLRLTPAG